MDRIQTTLPALGAAIEGGFFTGLIRIGDKTFGLIAAPKELGETIGIWGPNGAIPNAHSFFDGTANTEAMLEAGSEIAKWVRGLDIDGKTDWHIPSRDELELCYRNFKPSAEGNFCWSGDNPSSIPAGYPYAPESPAKSELDAFTRGGPGAFDPAVYWSSTQYAGHADYAWYQYFVDGSQYDTLKSFQGRVRAVRRFLID